MILISENEKLNALYNRRIQIECYRRKLAKEMIRVRDNTDINGVYANITISSVFGVVRVDSLFADLQPIFKEIMKQLDDEYQKVCIAISTMRAEMESLSRTSAGSC